MQNLVTREGKKGPWEGNKRERGDGKREGREREASGRGGGQGRN